MTVSILRTLARLPSGAFAADLTLAELGAYIGRQVGGLDEKARNERHALRDLMYRDGGVEHMQALVAKVHKDPDVVYLRQQWVPHARFNNAMKRIVNELSTVYAEPAKRIVEGDDNLAAYQSALDEVRMDEVMLQAGRLLNLHRALLVGFRVKEKASGGYRLVVDVATPASVRVVLDPSDPSEPVAWLVRTGYAPARAAEETPAWTLWSDHERMHLRDNFSVIPNSVVAHGFGRCPWVPITLGPPQAGFWPGDEGADLQAAHETIWLANVFLLKETKSATKVPVLSGDASNVARGQMADSEGMVELGDGAAISSIDTSMDLGMFTRTADHILEGAGHNYGISPALLHHQGVQSAEARELMRVPLRELRKQQQVPLRRFEREFAEVMAAVLAADLPARGFDTTGWRVEFGEAQTPLTGNEAVDLFLKERTAGLTDTFQYLMDRFDMTYEQATEAVQTHTARETLRNQWMRPMQAISGASGAEQTSTTGDGAPLILGAGDGPADNGTTKELPS